MSENSPAIYCREYAQIAPVPKERLNSPRAALSLKRVLDNCSAAKGGGRRFTAPLPATLIH